MSPIARPTRDEVTIFASAGDLDEAVKSSRQKIVSAPSSMRER